MLDKKMREKWKRAVMLLGCMALVFSGCGKTGDVKESGAVEQKTAAEQAEEVCGFIRKTVAGLFGQAVADGMTIQYGGSMNAGNAAELLSKPDVDGGLIGGASLKANDFNTIVQAAVNG